MINKRTNGTTSPSPSKTWLMIKASRATDVYFLEQLLNVLPVIESSMVITATSSTCLLLTMKIRIIFASFVGIKKTLNHTSKTEYWLRKLLSFIKINWLNKEKQLKNLISQKVDLFHQIISTFLKLVTRLFTSSKAMKSSINSTTASSSAVITTKCRAKTCLG